MNQVELVPVEYKDKQVLRNLMHLCLHDYAEFDGRDLNEHGMYEYKYLDHYWTEEGRHPFFIRVADQIAGFVLVREMDKGVSLEPTFSIAEFFIVRKYRKQGLGQTVACRIFESFPPGAWVVGQSLRNEPAQHFWRKVISAYTSGKYQESRDEHNNLLEFRTYAISE